ncbi:MAG TPA: HPF/RaiA family ribosome-associated protein [Kofleriaceae bacterium]|nr:HPF/RaiA family ribosome-associated protein [Kofleriaceae bacterium]
MQIQLNTDHHIKGREKLAAHVRSVVEDALHRFRDRTTRVEVHLSDEHGDKPGLNDKRCMMEARLEGRHPTAVTHHATTVHQAVEGAADKLESALERSLGRLRRHDDGRGEAAPPELRALQRWEDEGGSSSETGTGDDDAMERYDAG